MVVVSDRLRPRHLLDRREGDDGQDPNKRESEFWSPDVEEATRGRPNHSSSFGGRRLREKRDPCMPRYLRQPVDGSFTGLSGGDQLRGNETPHLMAAAMHGLGANLVENIFEACLKAGTNVAHDVTSFG